MAPVECTKCIAVAWDCTLNHSGVHWASPLPVDCSGVRVSSLESFPGQFLKSFCHLPPHSLTSLIPPPTPYYTGPKLECISKKSLEMA